MINWYCIYTKPGQEGAVSQKLGELPGMELFNPQFMRKKRVRSTYREVVEELFPCYLFLRFDRLEYFHLVKYTRGVRRFVGDRAGSPFAVEQELIEYIRKRLEDGAIYLDSPTLKKGETVRLMDGPFAGLSGIFLEEMKASERVLVLLNAIEYQARIQVPRTSVARG